MFSGLFGSAGSDQKKEAQAENAKAQSREWQRRMKSEMRSMEREIAKIKREEDKLKREVKQYASKGEMVAVRTLAKQLVGSRRATNRLYLAKTQLNSVCMELTAMTSTMRLADSLKQSTAIMQGMSQLMSIPQIRQEMTTMAREMQRAGLIQEVLDDAVEEALDADGEIEGDAEAETQAVLQELALDNLEGLKAPGQGSLTGGAASKISTRTSASTAGATSAPREKNLATTT